MKNISWIYHEVYKTKFLSAYSLLIETNKVRLRNIKNIEENFYKYLLENYYDISVGYEDLHIK